MIAYGVQMSTNVSDRHYDISQRSMSNIFKICVMARNAFILHLLMEDDDIWHVGGLWCVDDNESF